MLEKLIENSAVPIETLITSKKIDLRTSVDSQILVYHEQSCIQKVISQFLQLAAWQLSERDPIIRLS